MKWYIIAGVLGSWTAFLITINSCAEVAMHVLLPSFLLVLVAFALPVCSFPEANKGSLYRPIHIRDYEAAVGLHRREEEMIFDLEPKTEAQLIYGRHRDDGKLLLANMKLLASNGTSIVLLERFDHLTQFVDCHGEDGFVSLKFISWDVYHRALAGWSFINDDEDAKFLLIANHEDCSSADQRQPYL